MIRSVTGLCVLKHDTVTVVSLAGNYGDTVIVSYVEMQIFFINLSYFFHGHNTLAVDDRHMKCMFQIFIYGMTGNLSSKSGNRFLQKIVVVDDRSFQYSSGLRCYGNDRSSEEKCGCPGDKCSGRNFLLSWSNRAGDFWCKPEIRISVYLRNDRFSSIRSGMCYDFNHSQCSRSRWNSGNPLYSAEIYGKLCHLYGDRICSSDGTDHDRRKEKAFLTGKVIPLEEVNDGVFSAGVMGDGVAILPENDILYAPCDGEVTVLMDESRHACGLTLDNGMEILLHIGIDTVEMKGNGFEYLVALGQKVKAGTPLVRFDREKIQAAGHPDVTVCIVTEEGNAKNFKFITDIHVEAGKTTIVSYE